MNYGPVAVKTGSERVEGQCGDGFLFSAESGSAGKRNRYNHGIFSSRNPWVLTLIVSWGPMVPL